jgi:hypothetical protein
MAFPFNPHPVSGAQPGSRPRISLHAAKRGRKPAWLGFRSLAA